MRSMRPTPWKVALLASVFGRSMHAQAADPATLTYAYGANCRAAEAHRDMLIFEYANDWEYGDDYVYLEAPNLVTRRPGTTTVGAGETAPYAEVHARLSMKKLVDASIAAGPIRDLLFANQVDVSQCDMVLLTGAGIAWSIRGKIRFQTDVFVRYDPSLPHSTWQAVGYFSWPFDIGSTRLAYGGYVKFVGPVAPNAAFGERNRRAFASDLRAREAERMC